MPVLVLVFVLVLVLVLVLALLLLFQPIRSQRIAVSSLYEFVPDLSNIYIPPIDSQNVVIYRVAYIEKKSEEFGSVRAYI